MKSIYARIIPLFKKKYGEFNFIPFTFCGNIRKHKNSFVRIEILNISITWRYFVNEDED